MARKRKLIIPLPTLIKKNDKVEVIAGKEKGKTGKVMRVLRDKNRKKKKNGIPGPALRPAKVELSRKKRPCIFPM